MRISDVARLDFRSATRDNGDSYQMRYFRAILLAAVVGAGLPLCAQSNDPSELIRTLLERINSLEKRVAELEAQKVSSIPPAQPVTGPGMIPGGHHEAPPPAQDGEGPVMKISGFGDVAFAAADNRSMNDGFSEGQFILHIASALSPKVTYFGELSFTARRDAGLGFPPATGFNAEVERTIIRYDYNDHLKVSFGRYHTPVNYWNTAFHHGAWLQTTISRPEMTQFGGSFIPVHFVGGLVEGATPAAGLNVNYNFGLGNGRSSILSRAGDPGDVNTNRAWLANVFVRPDRFYPLQVGASVYRDRIDTTFERPTREWIRSAHVAWTKESPEFIAEIAKVDHTPIGSPVGNTSYAGYAQIALRLPFWNRQWKPYYRFEKIDIAGGDRLFAAIPELIGSTVGVRYDLTGFSALKLEYRNVKRPTLPRINAVLMQTSFTF